MLIEVGNRKGGKQMLKFLLSVATAVVTLKDGTLQNYDWWLIGMTAAIVLFGNPGGDHKDEKEKAGQKTS